MYVLNSRLKKNVIRTLKIKNYMYIILSINGKDERKKIINIHQ